MLRSSRKLMAEGIPFRLTAVCQHCWAFTFAHHLTASSNYVYFVYLSYNCLLMFLLHFTIYNYRHLKMFCSKSQKNVTEKIKINSRYWFNTIPHLLGRKTQNSIYPLTFLCTHRSYLVCIDALQLHSHPLVNIMTIFHVGGVAFYGFLLLCCPSELGGH